MENIQQTIIKFSEIKENLVNALNEKLKNNKLYIPEKVTIIEGFVNQPLSMELTGSFVIGGPAVPMIMLVGNDSGRIYYFALKAILPEIKI
ncbi:MAG: hypothetical protein PHG83_03580 [Patescibacteria group bacterium]|nr:hypothetical protein [Patescibacteria group bacterium]